MTDRAAAIAELLKTLSGEPLPEAISSGPIQIHVHGPVIFTADAATAASIKLLITAFLKTKKPD